MEAVYLTCLIMEYFLKGTAAVSHHPNRSPRREGRGQASTAFCILGAWSRAWHTTRPGSAGRGKAWIWLLKQYTLALSLHTLHTDGQPLNSVLTHNYRFQCRGPLASWLGSLSQRTSPCEGPCPAVLTKSCWRTATRLFLMWLIASTLINTNLNQGCIKIKNVNICKFKLSVLIIYMMTSKSVHDKTDRWSHPD